MDGWLAKHRGEDTTREGYEPKVRLHIKPHIGKVKVVEVTDERLDELYRLLETTPIEANGNKPLGPKSVRHVHNIISAALDSVTGPRKLLAANPAHTPPHGTADQGGTAGLPDPQRSRDPALPQRDMEAVRQPGVRRRADPPLSSGRSAVDGVRGHLMPP